MLIKFRKTILKIVSEDIVSENVFTLKKKMQVCKKKINLFN